MSPRLVPVGKNLFGGAGFARTREAGFLRALDLCDAPVVNDELDDAITETFDFFAHERDPVRMRRKSSSRRSVGRGWHGCRWLDRVIAQEVVKNALSLMKAGAAGTAGKFAGMAGWNSLRGRGGFGLL
jgi:hypothetical protein